MICTIIGDMVCTGINPKEDNSDKNDTVEEYVDYDEFLDDDEKEERRIILEETDFWEAYDEALKPYYGGCGGNDKQR